MFSGDGYVHYLACRADSMDMFMSKLINAYFKYVQIIVPQ